jgi:GR25 family glycosyltransferase involved in LPS biosynthesis
MTEPTAAIILIILILYFSLRQSIEGFSDGDGGPGSKLKTYVINLDKNIVRWDLIKSSYPHTDLATIPVERFSAVVGKTVDTSIWLNDAGIAELVQVEKDGYRTRHYQLTRGGIGCFLSHYILAQKLLEDNVHDTYLIFEDDAGFPKDTMKQIKETLDISPSNWDIILLGTHRVHGLPLNNFIKVSAFWGLFGYLINKSGAKKLVESVDKTKIDAQLDTYMAWMAQKGNLNVYATKKAIVYDNNILRDTDIQMRLVEMRGVDPYLYKNCKV